MLLVNLGTTFIRHALSHHGDYLRLEIYSSTVKDSSTFPTSSLTLLMRLGLSDQYVLVLASDDRRRHGYRCSILEAVGRLLAAAATGALTTE